MSSPPRAFRHPRAEKDIEEQVEHYLFTEKVPAVAARFVDAVQDGLDVLASFPELGTPCGFAAPGLADLRRWPVPGFRNHILFYRPGVDRIELVRVLHGAREPDWALSP